MLMYCILSLFQLFFVPTYFSTLVVWKYYFNNYNNNKGVVNGNGASNK